MDKPLQGEKENTPTLQPFQNNYSLLQPTAMQFLPPNLQKKPKANKVKSQKGFSSNLRAGDWVCLICNNLNFSFRNECNRCQIQTKEQNQIQTIYLAENPNLQTNDPQIRLPFQDLTNQKYSQLKIGQPGFHSKSKSTPMQSEFDLNLVSRLPTGAETQLNAETNPDSKKLSSSNKGFQNMLLVTPPKHRQNKSVNIFKEYSDSSQKELPPYRSPEHLPSISPILKNVFRYDFKDMEYHEDKINNSLKFLKEESEEFESNEEERMISNLRGDLLQRNIAREDLGLFAHVNSQNLRLKQSPLHPMDELNYFQSGKIENKDFQQQKTHHQNEDQGK